MINLERKGIQKFYYHAIPPNTPHLSSLILIEWRKTVEGEKKGKRRQSYEDQDRFPDCMLNYQPHLHLKQKKTSQTHVYSLLLPKMDSTWCKLLPMLVNALSFPEEVRSRIKALKLPFPAPNSIASSHFCLFFTSSKYYVFIWALLSGVFCKGHYGTLHMVCINISQDQGQNVLQVIDGKSRRQE